MNEKKLEELLHLTKPKVIGLIITKKDNQIDLCPVNWQAVSSRYENPMVVCVGLNAESYTLENILKTKEFVYSYPSSKQLQDTLYCGTVSGRAVNKVKNTSFQFLKSVHISVPKIKDAVMNFECRLFKSVSVGNYTIIIGKILKIDASNKNQLDKIYTLGNNNYGIIEHIKTLQKGEV